MQSVSYNASNLDGAGEHPVGVEATVNCDDGSVSANQPWTANKKIKCYGIGNWSDIADCVKS